MPKRLYCDLEEIRQQLTALLEGAHVERAVIISKRGTAYAALVPVEALPDPRPRPSVVALRGSGAGLWGKSATVWVDRLRNEW